MEAILDELNTYLSKKKRPPKTILSQFEPITDKHL